MAQLTVLQSDVAQTRSHAGYRLVIETSRKRMRAVFNDQVIADSDQVLVMHETSYAPVYYFPRADVRMDLLRPTDLRTHCPFKGDANYWTIEVEGRSAPNAAWSYEDPYQEAAIVKDHIAFYWDRIDAWFEDGEPITERPPRTVAATANPLSTG